jgi:hypothetical protein
VPLVARAGPYGLMSNSRVNRVYSSC